MRRKDREITGIDQLLKIIDKCEIIRIGMYDPDTGEIYIVPLNYGYTYENDTLTFYMHGANEGHKYEILKKNPKVGFEMECDVQPFEGPVPCLYGMAFKSIIGHGEISWLDNVEDKIEAMKILMKVQTGKDFDFTEKLLSIVRMFKLTVTDMTGKYKDVPPALVSERAPKWI